MTEAQKYYAGEGQISTEAIEGGVEITQEEYAVSLQAILSGKTIAIRSDSVRYLNPETITIYDIEGQSKQIADNDDIPEGWSTDAPPPSTQDIIAGIKAEAARRISDSGHDWMALRKVTTGDDVPQEVIDYAVAVRAASNALEETLPINYTDDSHWPNKIQGA